MNSKKDWGLTVRGVVRKEDKILILRRHPKSRNNPHKWELPGGKVDPGEFFDVALVREFKEETNLDVKIESLFEVVQDEFISRRTNQPISTVQLMMNLEIIDGEVQISSEHDDYKWVSKEELKELYDEGMLTATLKLTLEKRSFEIWKDKKYFIHLFSYSLYHFSSAHSNLLKDLWLQNQKADDEQYNSNQIV